jgi:DNA-directed RNA polymerase specialized sigma24 family protein
MTPEKAIARLQTRPDDEEAWASIYTYMQERLNNYVSSLVCAFNTGPKESPRDLVHEAVTGFWQQWPEIKETIPHLTAAYAYLKTSCRNSLVDKYRHDRSAQPLLDFLTLKFSEVQPNSIVRSLLVQEVIVGVGGECGALLRSYVESGLSLAEMADREGSIPAAFYSRWYRCLEKARNFAAPKWPTGFQL